MSSQLYTEKSNVNLPCGYCLQLFELKRSGLTICIINSVNPIVRLNFLVPTLGTDDSGEPHCLEHLVFRGSKHFPQVGILDALANMSLSSGTNAYTMVDRTVYTVDVGSEEGLLQLLPCYLDHIIFPLITPTSFQSEVYYVDENGVPGGVVFSEMETAMSEAFNLLYYQVCLLGYDNNSPLRYNTGGDTKLIPHLTIDKVCKVHEKFYKPNRITISLVGKLDVNKVLNTLINYESQYLQSFFSENTHARPSPYQSALHLQPPKTQHVVSCYPANSDSDLTYYSISMNIGNMGNQFRYVAIDCLIRYLCEGSTSLLQSNFVFCPDAPLVQVDYELIPYGQVLLFMVFIGQPNFHLNKVIDSIERIVQNPVQLSIERMKSIIKQSINSAQEKLAKSPEKLFAERIHHWWLYSSDNELGGGSILPFLQVEDMLQELYEKPAAFWINLLRSILTHDRYFVTLNPNQQLSAEKTIERQNTILENVKNNVGQALVEERDQEMIDKFLSKFQTIACFNKSSPTELRSLFCNTVNSYYTNAIIPTYLVSPKTRISYVNLSLYINVSSLINRTADNKYMSLSEFLLSVDGFDGLQKVDNITASEHELFKSLTDENCGLDNTNCNKLKDLFTNYVLCRCHIGHLIGLLGDCLFKGSIHVTKELATVLELTPNTVILTPEQLDLYLRKYLTDFKIYQGCSWSNCFEDVIQSCIKFSSDDSTPATHLLHAVLTMTRFDSDIVMSCAKKCLGELQEYIRRGKKLLNCAFTHEDYDIASSSMLNDSPHIQSLIYKFAIINPNLVTSLLQSLITLLSEHLSSKYVHLPGEFLYLYASDEKKSALLQQIHEVFFNSSAPDELQSIDSGIEALVENVYQECRTKDLNKIRQLALSNSSSDSANIRIDLKLSDEVISLLAKHAGYEVSVIRNPSSFEFRKCSSPMRVLLEYYNSQEGPLFRPVRNSGAAYGAGASLDLELYKLSVFLSSCSRPELAMSVARSSLLEQLTNLPTQHDFLTAKSAALYSALRHFDNPHNFGDILCYNSARGIDARDLIYEISTVDYDLFVELNKLVCKSILDSTDKSIAIVGREDKLNDLLQNEKACDHEQFKISTNLISQNDFCSSQLRIDDITKDQMIQNVVSLINIMPLTKFYKFCNISLEVSDSDDESRESSA